MGQLKGTTQIFHSRGHIIRTGYQVSNTVAWWFSFPSRRSKYSSQNPMRPEKQFPIDCLHSRCVWNGYQDASNQNQCSDKSFHHMFLSHWLSIFQKKKKKVYRPENPVQFGGTGLPPLVWMWSKWIIASMCALWVPYSIFTTLVPFPQFLFVAVSHPKMIFFFYKQFSSFLRWNRLEDLQSKSSSIKSSRTLQTFHL